MGISVLAIYPAGTMTGKDISETSPPLFSWEDDKLASLTSRSSVGKHLSWSHAPSPFYLALYHLNSHFSWGEPQNWVTQLLNERDSPSCSIYPGTSKLVLIRHWTLEFLLFKRQQKSSPSLAGGPQPESVMGCETLDRSIPGLGLSLLASKSRGSGPGSKVGLTQLAGRANELSPKSETQRGSRYCPGVEDAACPALG